MKGEVKYVDPNEYEAIIEKYLQKIRGIQNVLGVAQIGSVTAPGLSDIDLVVTVPDTPPWPTWEEISLLSIAKNMRQGAVVFHDVFVVPESIALNMEAFFFVDQQRVFIGSELGGAACADYKRPLSRFIALEYAFHRLESLMGMLLQDNLSLRAAVLFVSTLRHSLTMAVDLEVLTPDTAALMSEDILQLRNATTSGENVEEMLVEWPDTVFSLTWAIIEKLGREICTDSDDHLPVLWDGGPRLGFVDVAQDRSLSVAGRLNKLQRSNVPSKRIRLIPTPRVFHRHIAAYMGLPNNVGTQLSKVFPNIGKIVESDSDNASIRLMRASQVIRHWEFLHKAGYQASSGHGYIGLNSPNQSMLRTLVLSMIRDHYRTRFLNLI
jgi:hypothetical protein